MRLNEFNKKLEDMTVEELYAYMSGLVDGMNEIMDNIELDQEHIKNGKQDRE